MGQWVIRVSDVDLVATLVRIYVHILLINNTVTPHLPATSLIRLPHYSDHVM